MDVRARLLHTHRSKCDRSQITVGLRRYCNDKNVDGTQPCREDHPALRTAEQGQRSDRRHGKDHPGILGQGS